MLAAQLRVQLCLDKWIWQEGHSSQPTAQSLLLRELEGTLTESPYPALKGVMVRDKEALGYCA